MTNSCKHGKAIFRNCQKCALELDIKNYEKLEIKLPNQGGIVLTNVNPHRDDRITITDELDIRRLKAACNQYLKNKGE